jgi:hypothetical protein
MKHINYLGRVMCPHGCLSVEGPEHIFRLCPAYRETREEANHQLIIKLSSIAKKQKLTQRSIEKITSITNGYFSCSNSLYSCTSIYYYGLVPSLDIIMRDLQSYQSLNAVQRKRIISNIHAEIHNSAIILTGRIWSIRTNKILDNIPKLQRDTTKPWSRRE